MKLKKILTIDQLEKAFQKVCDNRGSPGIDGVSVQSFLCDLRRKLQKLILEVMTHQYRAFPCKVVGIPKNHGKTRYLAIPTIRDRVIHTAISQAFIPFFEHHFEVCSYGYRPQRNYLQAVSQIETLRDQGYWYVLDADIDNYFNNIPHNLLKMELQKYVQCDDLISLIFQSIKHMQYHRKVRLFGTLDGLGLPQGSPLSPVLANIYLDGLDEMLMDKDFKIIRYADDFVVMCKSLQAASRALKLTNEWLDSYQLKLNAVKTRVTDFDNGFVFLGHFFIDQLVQKLSTNNKEVHAAQWQWDGCNYTEENHKHAFSGQPISIENDSPDHYQLQQMIIGCEDLNDIDTHNNNKQQSTSCTHLNLTNKLRTLYLFKQGSVIHKIAGKFEVRHGNKVLQKIPITQVDSIMCFGAIHMTRAVIIACFKQAMPIVMMSKSGKYQGIIRPDMAMDKILHNRQLSSHNDPLPNAKLIVAAKLQNSLTMLRRYLRYRQSELKRPQALLSSLSKLKKRLVLCKSLNSLRGIEGNSARIYFTALRSMIPEQWHFTTRNRQPPQDPVNAMLSLGYTILFNNIYAFIMLRELTMEYGYLHAHYHKQPALALDMMEPFRSVIVDAVVLKLICNEILHPDDFHYENQACLLTTKAKKLFVTTMEQQMSKQLRYEALCIKTDYRRIMDLQVLLLKQSLLSDAIAFQPFSIR